MKNCSVKVFLYFVEKLIWGSYRHSCDDIGSDRRVITTFCSSIGVLGANFWTSMTASMASLSWKIPSHKSIDGRSQLKKKSENNGST